MQSKDSTELLIRSRQYFAQALELRIRCVCVCVVACACAVCVCVCVCVCDVSACVCSLCVLRIAGPRFCRELPRTVYDRSNRQVSLTVLPPAACRWLVACVPARYLPTACLVCAWCVPGVCLLCACCVLAVCLLPAAACRCPACDLRCGAPAV